jgi:hypothetical protein
MDALNAVVLVLVYNTAVIIAAASLAVRLMQAYPVRPKASLNVA